MPKSTIIPRTMIMPNRLMTLKVISPIFIAKKAAINAMGILQVTIADILVPSRRNRISASRKKPVIALV